MSCSSGWKLLLLSCHPRTSHRLLIYILMQGVGNQSKAEVKRKPPKAAGQLEKHPSPTFPRGHLKRRPAAGKADGPAI